MTRNFRRQEFACQGEHCCGHSAPISPVLVRGLQQLRDDLSAIMGRDVVIIVTSGFRCITHDLEEAERRGETPDQLAARNSQHCMGSAADIIAPRAGPDLIEEVAEGIPAFRDGGLGRYTGSREQMVHLDVRGVRARWRE